MKTFALIAALFSLPVFAVQTRNCPESFTVSYRSVSAMRNQQVRESLSIEAYLQVVLAARNVLRQITTGDHTRIEFTLLEKKNSECRYTSPIATRSGHPHEQARLQTRNGRDFIRIPLLVGEDTFWIYHNVTHLAPDAVGVSKLNGVVLGYENSSGGPAFAVGFANGLSMAIR